MIDHHHRAGAAPKQATTGIVARASTVILVGCTALIWAWLLGTRW